MDRLEEHLEEKRLVLNTEKSKVIRFKIGREQTKNTLEVEGEDDQGNEEFRYLRL